jgi:hypothetical protein
LYSARQVRILSALEGLLKRIIDLLLPAIFERDAQKAVQLAAL